MSAVLNRLFTASLTIALAACSVAPEGVDVHDPYEEQNRRVHAFNKSVDENVFGAFKGEDGGDGPGIPVEIADPVVNFADNVALPGMVLNGLLQGDIGGAATNTMRFIVNSTVGVGGAFDPADTIGLLEQETDFGETLAVWGVPEGAYVEVPILGPSTERDLAGRIVDAIIDPLDAYGTQPMRDYGTLAKLAGRAIKRSQFGDTVDSVLHDSADSYASQRLIYLQNRRFELGQTSDADAIDPYDDLFGDQ